VSGDHARFGEACASGLPQIQLGMELRLYPLQLETDLA
jgi:hypothetical protein